MKRPVLVLLMVLLASQISMAFGHESNLWAAHHKRHLSISNTGMMVLGGWALANMGTGAWGWSRLQGESMYFHQMNFFWNIVNASIAGFALYSNWQTDPFSMDPQLMLSEQKRMERILLINAGLDIGYMAGGFLMTRLSSGYPAREQLLRGYGRSVIMQGAFLLVFDIVLYFIFRSHRTSIIFPAAIAPGLSLDRLPAGMGISIGL